MRSDMKRKREFKAISDPTGGTKYVEYYWYECAEGHTAAGDTQICYDCVHQSNHANPQRVNNFYARYGLNK